MGIDSIAEVASRRAIAGKGALDGMTILRFAHAYDSGGGTERYLDDVDGILLARNEVTIIRLHLTRENGDRPAIEESIGRGRLIRNALPVIPGAMFGGASVEGSWKYRLKQFARTSVLYNPVVWRLFGEQWTREVKLARKPGQAIGAAAAVREVLAKYRVNIAVLHFFGGADAGDVLDEVAHAGIPALLVNHYSNDRLLYLANRKHIIQADAIAGVNGLQVPRYLRGRFENVSDGIDTNFFRRELARPLPKSPGQPVVFMPARLTREKGQLDLVHAVAELKEHGPACRIAFAGRVDGSKYVSELRCKIDELKMTESVEFLGDLGLEALRDWYAASSVVAFPTYHHEGLGRVTVEAQAMGVPAVAYSTGGVAEGIIHGKTGYVVPTGDIKGLALRIGELLRSPELRENMGKCGREFVEKRFSLSALATRHEEVYLKVIAARRGAGIAELGTN
jgi:glycosyltransferase involved in cell wall biosynthesis